MMFSKEELCLICNFPWSILFLQNLLKIRLLDLIICSVNTMSWFLPDVQGFPSKCSNMGFWQYSTQDFDEDQRNSWWRVDSLCWH